MNADTLYNLLPAIYRLRDAEQGEPLRALMSVLTEQAAVLQENLEQLYDDQFIETAAPWAVAYIGDLIGYRSLNTDASPALGSPRSEVANTIGYRRRKGTAAMLEQLARDVTGWDAAVVEFFQFLGTTQYLNHVRPDNHYAPHISRAEALEVIGTPFDRVCHTADVRRISSGRGKHNIPNIGIYLWRIGEHSLTRSPAVPAGGGRYRFHPLGIDAPLYNDALPVPDFAGLATPANVPQPIERRAMARDVASYFGPGKSLLVELHPRDSTGALDLSAAPAQVPENDILVCDLSDVPDGVGGTAWAHMPVPAGKMAVDPHLGRLAFGAEPADAVLVSFHYGFPAESGGGEYERAASFQEHLEPVATVSGLLAPGPLQAALTALAGGGAVVIQDSSRYEETLSLSLAEEAHVEVRGRNGSRPTLILGADWGIQGGPGSELTLNGLLIAGADIRVSGQLSRLRLVHCTLRGSLFVEAPGVVVEIEHSIAGSLFIHRDSQVAVSDSIIDAGALTGWAFRGPAQGDPGGELTVTAATVLGRIHATAMPLASNSIFHCHVPEGEPVSPLQYPVRVDRRQEGCVRFSYVPPGSRTPRRHACQPADGGDSVRVRPQFASLIYGDAGYGQLGLRCAPEIRTGADDGSEMGVYHGLLAPHRVANLRVRLDEYLRFGLEAGIFFVS